MATDPQTAPDTAPTWSASPIENELPTYRAISTWAIGALTLGVISAATFASLNFLIASIGAIACGAIALRMIRRYPDLLTGAGLANVGIALGLITGLAAPTISFVQHSILARQARAYGDLFSQTLQEKGLADAFWIAQPPSRREQTTPQKLLAEVEANSQQQMMEGGDPRLIGLRSMAERLASSSEQHIYVDGIEAKGFEGITPFAYIRLGLDGPESEKYPALQYALIKVEATKHDGRREWFVQDLTFPYTSGSRANVVESAHGHDH
ncbi:DUF4190 domain-containing protein [Tautonia sociabilis]|uniref:DUF4190 domain-containing protein n=1 Tax=Tautonia sociabilis TaxID=2080755 RepID=A0A432MNJ3_9BACT|nr:DUF4190 domain-containing protein [Tautonia sociabilis]RUL89004.1 DUF4190 domain-containing protein [Tautonia sociabilis]